MAHLILPSTIPAMKTLVQAIDAKNTDLGDESPIKLLLTENDIVLADDIAALTTADTHEQAAATLRRSSENATALRNLKVDPIMKQVTGISQLLKKFYKGNASTLGTWGITITTTGKIVYPTDINDKVTLVKNIRAKHESFAAGASPLQAYLTANTISLSNMQTVITDALEFNKESKYKANISEYEIEQRDLLTNPVTEHLKTIGNYLMEFYAGNTRELGLWGFTVDESTSKPTERTSRIKLLDKITINNVVFGSTIFNVGPTEIHLYKGKTTTGNPVIIPPNGKFGVPKGYSIITISNPSADTTAIVKVMRTK